MIRRVKLLLVIHRDNYFNVLFEFMVKITIALGIDYLKLYSTYSPNIMKVTSPFYDITNILQHQQTSHKIIYSKK